MAGYVNNLRNLRRRARSAALPTNHTTSARPSPPAYAGVGHDSCRGEGIAARLLMTPTQSCVHCNILRLVVRDRTRVVASSECIIDRDKYHDKTIDEYNRSILI